MWDVRGGGLYACGFAATFIVLELGSLIDDVADVGMLFDGRAWDFLLGLVIDSFRNTLQAFMWPVYVARFEPPAGAIALGLAFAVFPRWIKPHVERWLFGDVPPPEVAADAED